MINVLSHFNLGVQLWSVRNQLRCDTNATLAHLAKIGFRSVETLDLHQTRQLKPILDNYALSVTSSFIFWGHFTDNWPLYSDANYYPWPKEKISYTQLAEQCATLGLKRAVIGYIPLEERNGIDHYKRYCDNICEAGEAFNKTGVELSYHNHAFEFEVLNSGFIFFDYLLDNVPSDILRIELDIFWCHITGNSPTRLIDTLNGRITSLHVKGVNPGYIKTYNDHQMAKRSFVPLDKSEIVLKPLLQQAKKSGIRDIYIEQDHSRHIFSDLKQSFDFIRTI